MSERIQRLSEENFIALGYRVFEQADRMMTDYASGSSDALKFGWDWPTFSVLFPRKYRFWRKFLSEAERRGLKGKRLNVPDRAFKK